MTIRKQIAVVAMLGALSAVAMTTQASADPVSAKRAQALRVCNERALQAYPTPVPEGHHGRSDVYKACMTDAGELP